MAADWLDFRNQAVIVTGAAAGIGLACARAFAEAGADVVFADINAERNEAAARAVAQETGARTFAFAGDLADEQACGRLVGKTLERFGRIDVLVNNAGIVRAGSILDLPAEEFDRVLAVNLRSYFVLTQLVARSMVEAGTKGAIVNMSSLNSVLAIPNQLAYVTSKGGLQQLTKAAALGLAEYGIRVNAIGPGSIMSDLLKTVVSDDAARRGILARTPLGRIGEPEEIAAIALFLASPMASYVTGQTIFADGGRAALNYTVPVREE
ncbi:MAG: SDR family oxidoreductase [Alphaproteobacteria bacterium]|nr:SDR family oxidoreductase [Alphaproteobacteria bacterium]